MMLPENIFITYNDDAHIRKGDVDGRISMQGVSVSDTANLVKKAIEEKGVSPTLVQLRDNPQTFINRLTEGKPDIIFNLCEEAFAMSSMEKNVAGLYELFGFRYTGSDPLTLGVCLNKGMTKDILCARGIPTSPYKIIKDEKSLCQIPLKFPIIVKPLKEDAGLGIDNNAVVYDAESLEKRAMHIITVFKQPVLVEEYIDGREFNVSVIGNKSPCVLPVSEIDFSGLPRGMNKIVGYEAKWAVDSVFYKNTVPVCPADVSDKVKERLSEIALSVYKVFDCRDYARVDIRMGSDNIPKVLEVNPNPDISPNAGLAKSAKADGISYADLICKIINFAVDRYF